MRRILILLLTVALVPLALTYDATADTSGRREAAAQESARARTLYLRKKVAGADIICEKKRAARDRPGKCKRVTTLRTSSKYHPVRPGARTGEDNHYWCRDWVSTSRGLYYVNWKEEARGRFCWIEGPAAPNIYRNTWKCGYSSAIGYDVQVEDCWDEKRHGDTTYGWWISVYDKWRVSAAFRGFPLHWTYQTHVNLHPTGTVTMKVDD